MNEVIIVLALGFASLLGYSIIRGFNFIPRDDVVFSLGISYGLGVGLIAYQLYWYTRFGIVWTRESILLPWIIFIIGIRYLRRSEFRITIPKKIVLTRAQQILLLGILLTSFYVVFEALLRPLTVWDGWATWLFEAKVFFIDGKISAENMQYMGASYPLIYPLISTYCYIILGHVDDTAILLTSVFFYAFLTLSFFAVIRKRLGLTYGLVWTFMFVTVQNLIRHGGRLEAGIADLPQGYFIFISTMLLLLFLKNSSQKILFLLIVFLGFTALIKNEGIPFLLISTLIILFHLYKHKLYSYLLYFIIPAGMLLDWQVYKVLLGVNHLYAEGHPFEMSLPKSIQAVMGTGKELLTIKSWNLLWITYFYSLIWIKVKNAELRILHILIIFQLGAYLFVYLTTYGNAPDSSIERLLIHIAPVTILAVTYYFQELSSKLSKIK